MIFSKSGTSKKAAKTTTPRSFSKDPVLVSCVFDVKIFAENPQEFRLHVRGELDEVHLRRLLVEPRFCVIFWMDFSTGKKKTEPIQQSLVVYFYDASCGKL